MNEINLLLKLTRTLAVEDRCKADRRCFRFECFFDGAAAKEVTIQLKILLL